MKTPERKFLEKIKADFPKIRWDNAKLVRHGWDHDVVVLDDKIIFRFPNSPKMLGLLESEVGLLRKLRPALPVNIPDYEWVGNGFAGYRIINGSMMTTHVYSHLSVSQKKRLALTMAGFLTALHTVPAKSLGQFRPPQTDITSGRVEKYHAKAKKYAYPRMSKSIIKTSEAYFETWSENLSFPTAVVTHADLKEDHLLVSKGNLQGIIDWSDRQVGDPAHDFSFLWVYGPKFVATVYNSYDGPKDEALLYRSLLMSLRIPITRLADVISGRIPADFQQNKLSYWLSRTDQTFSRPLDHSLVQAEKFFG